MTLFVGFLLGLCVGSILTAIALLLAIGVTAKQDAYVCKTPEEAAAALDAIRDPDDPRNGFPTR